MAGISAQAVVVIPPQTRIGPVVAAVSQATRAVSSWAIRLSRIASLIWSHSLSGWPSVTLSLVKNDLGLVIKLLMFAGGSQPPPSLRGIRTYNIECLGARF